MPQSESGLIAVMSKFHATSVIAQVYSTSFTLASQINVETLTQEKFDKNTETLIKRCAKLSKKIDPEILRDTISMAMAEGICVRNGLSHETDFKKFLTQMDGTIGHLGEQFAQMQPEQMQDISKRYTKFSIKSLSAIEAKENQGPVSEPMSR